MEAQATHLKPRSRATLKAAVMPVSLNDPVGFMPLMLGKELIDAQSLAGAGQRVEGRVALAQRHGIAKTIENGQQFAEAPHAGVIEFFGGTAPLTP